MFRAPFPIDREPFDTAFHLRDDRRRTVRADLKIAENSLVLGIVGKLVPWKRQIDLIEALRHLEDSEVHLTALIVGSGQDEQLLRTAAATLKRHTVVFAGFVPPIDLPKSYCG